jgi:hypothetical protein
MRDLLSRFRKCVLEVWDMKLSCRSILIPDPMSGRHLVVGQQSEINPHVRVVAYL